MGIKHLILAVFFIGNVVWQTGIASWYGYEAPNLRTANGERWNPEGISVAHKTLPFGTILEIINLHTSAVIRARVNDRGPYVKGRVLDLSKGAAKVLGVYGPGTAKVMFRVVEGWELL
jgi:rare lipoprotein A